MTLEEIRTIREKQSLETIGMTTEQLHEYFSKDANNLKKRKLSKNDNTAKPQ